MITSIYVNSTYSDYLDLNSENTLELKNSIVEVQDISKVFTETSNTITVPATDKNNKIFNSFYNPNILNGWDIYNKVDAFIELSGLMYKQGKIKLNSVLMRNGLPYTYTFQFFGLLTSLKDLLKDDKLSSLDLSQYDFNLDSNTAISQLTTSNLDIIRTTLSKDRLIYDSSSSVGNEGNVKNIANNGSNNVSGIDWFKTGVSIKNIRIIESIEQKYGVTFSRDYLNSINFSSLYLLLSGGNDVFREQITFTSSNDPTLTNNTTLLYNGGQSTLRVDVELFKPSFDSNNSDITIITYSKGVEINKKTANIVGGSGLKFSLKPSDFDSFENITFFAESKDIFQYKFKIRRFFRVGTSVGSYRSEKDFSNISGVFNVSKNMPDLKIIDYLKGFFQKDKLVAINTSENEIYLDSLVNYYRKGQVKDFTKYIDFKEIPISVGKLLSNIEYKFKEPQTILQKEFFNNNDFYYGDLDFIILDKNGNNVKGDSIKVELPFENMIYERIYDLSGVDDINFMYGYMADENLNEVNLKTHIHYSTRIDTNIRIRVVTGINEVTLIDDVNIPIHTEGLNTPQFSTTFGEEFNEYNGNKITNTIYSNFHKDYVSNAFEGNKRIFKYKAKNIPIIEILSLNLNDVIEIKEQYYRINKYNLNLVTGDCDFELYNVQNLDLTPLQSVTWDSNDITFDSNNITFDNT